MRVEARYQGSVRFYPGKIAAVHKPNNTFSIHFDDGGKDEEVRPSSIRLPEAKERNCKDSAPIDETEVTKQSGTPLDPAHCLTTCRTDQIRDPTSLRLARSRVMENGANELKKGMRVEARYQGSVRFYPGKIAAVHKPNNTVKHQAPRGERKKLQRLCTD